MLTALLWAVGGGGGLGFPGRPVALVELAGRPLVRHALDGVPGCDVTVLVSPGDEAPVAAAVRDRRVRVTSIPEIGDGDVLVHDLMRPLAPPTLGARVSAAVRAHGEPVVPVLPVTDTVRSLGPGPVAPGPSGSASGSTARVRDAVDRAGLRHVQTPVGVPARWWDPGLLAGRPPGPDLGSTLLAALIARSTRAVRTVEGDPLAFPVTDPAALTLAEALVSR